MFARQLPHADDGDGDKEAAEVAAALAAAKRQAAAAAAAGKATGSKAAGSRASAGSGAFLEAMLKAEQAHERREAAGAGSGADKLEQLMARKGQGQQVCAVVA